METPSPERDSQFRVKWLIFCFLAVDGGWSEWSDWSLCSQSCGPGYKSKSRTCTNPAPSGAGEKCSGESIERDECYKGPCPSKYHESVI